MSNEARIRANVLESIKFHMDKIEQSTTQSEKQLNACYASGFIHGAVRAEVITPAESEAYDLAIAKIAYGIN